MRDVCTFHARKRDLGRELSTGYEPISGGQQKVFLIRGEIGVQCRIDTVNNCASPGDIRAGRFCLRDFDFLFSGARDPSIACRDGPLGRPTSQTFTERRPGGPLIWDAGWMPLSSHHLLGNDCHLGFEGQEMQLRLIGALGASLAAAFMLSGCTTNQAAYDFYDDCRSRMSSFVEMVECGKRARLAVCRSWTNPCSRSGDAFMDFADSLALAVRNKEMTEAEALRRYAEYKTQFIRDVRRDQAIRDAGPSTCVRSGNMVNCF